MASHARSKHSPLHRHVLARAVSHALALGLAMSATAPALAGTCDVSDPTAATCDGIFAGTNISYAIEDLTLVVGGDSATSIDPADGMAGIDLSASYGQLDLVSYSDISTSYATGIQLQTYSGDIHVSNQGSIETYDGDGIQARTYYGDIDIDNFGVVDASVVYYGSVTGIRGSSFAGDVAVYVAAGASVSASTDNFYGGTATGVRANSSLGGAGVDNLGTVSASAQAYYGNATAYGVLDRGGYYGLTSMENAGSISATASTGDGVGWAWGIRVRGRYAEQENSGTVSAQAYAGSGYASASAVYVRGSTASSSNSGDIYANATVGGDGQALSYGMMTWGYYESQVHNSGGVAAFASVGSGTAVAMGSNSYYDLALAVDNSGSFYANAYSGLGIAEAVGIAGYAHDSTDVTNGAGGEVHAVGGVDNGYAFAYGVLLDAGEHVALYNEGTILAEASASDSGYFEESGGEARTIGASLVSAYGEALLYNSAGASISAHSTVYGDYGRAYAFGAVSQGSDFAQVDNHGTIEASAYSIAGSALSLGDIAYGTFAINLNYDTVSAQSTVAGEGLARSIGQYAFGEVATVVNEGLTQAGADVGEGYAYATGARLEGASVGAFNYGQVEAQAQAGYGVVIAQGIAAYSMLGASVSNYENGTVSATATVGVGDATAVGIYAYAYAYGAAVVNAGQVEASASSGYGSASAAGVVEIAYIFGDVDFSNSGTVQASAIGPGDVQATGAAIQFYDGVASVDNAGTISASADSYGGMYGTAEATGLSVEYFLGKYNLPVASAVNHGDISAVATREGEYGFARATGASIFALYAGDLYNAGDISASAIADGDYAGSAATGAGVFAKYGVNIDNVGTIEAQAGANHGGQASATGLGAGAYYGDAVLYNLGAITATATAAFDGEHAGQAYAGGVNLQGNYVVALYNAGTISAQAQADHGSAQAVGFVGSGKYDIANIDNGGDILAVAAGYYATATGSRISSKYGASTHNDGLVGAYAYAEGYGSAQAAGSVTTAPGAHGYNASAIGAQLYNSGEIRALAVADVGQALAIGARVEGAQDAGAYTWNDGLVYAGASVGGGGAFATGVRTWSYYGDVWLVNLGDIEAVASASAGGSASATGSITRAQGFGPPGYPAGVANLYNLGDISAVATALDGAVYATAAMVVGEAGAVVYNGGTLSATAEGDTGLATALSMISNSVNTLSNYGAIVATGNGSAHVAIYSNTYASAVLANHGLIQGSIFTGARDDELHNYADGTLRLADDVVDLGGWDEAGNSFVNEGTIVVRGDDNRIAMGTVEGLLASSNPYAFTNDGLIDFHDGHPDDVLEVAGDLDGHGHVALDADGASGAADRLDVNGNVLPGSVQTLDVWFTGLPRIASSSLLLASVSGASSASNFVLGQVHGDVDPGFLALGFGLRADLDASNVHADEFLLDVDVTGLSDAGTLAATLSSAAQQLVASQVGTRRDAHRPGNGLWARVFGDRGDVSPDHEARDFGDGGNFDFEQRASGIEAGIDFAVTGELDIGALLSTSQGRQELRHPGHGNSRLDADGYGLYANWHPSGGLVLEGTWRHLDMDAKLVGLRSDGHADSLDLYAAYAWTSASGLRLEPQLQYTRTNIGDFDTLDFGATHWASGDSGSQLARVGIEASESFGEGGDWRWTPYGAISALHEFDGDADYAINGDFHGSTSTSGSSLRLDAGVDATHGALSLAASLSWQDGGALGSLLGGQLSLRYAW